MTGSLLRSATRALRPAAGIVGIVAVSSWTPGCGGESADAQARAAVPDSALEAILGSVSEDPALRTSSPRSSPRLTPQEQAGRPLKITEMGYNQGPADAPLKVLEVSDFGCGYCRRFHEEVYPALKRIYMDTGFIEWKQIPFVLGMFPNGYEAAIAGECAGEQEAFFELQPVLYREQRQWRNSEDPYALFVEFARAEGLDAERFHQCITSGWRENRVRANIRLGQQLGVRGTPTFIIDGRPLPGALPLDSFRDILDASLRQRGITPPPR